MAFWIWAAAAMAAKGDMTSVTMKASSGGVVALDTVKIVIPPGALSKDTTVTMTELDYSSLDKDDPSPLLPLSGVIRLDLGGAAASGEFRVDIAAPKDGAKGFSGGDFVLRHQGNEDLILEGLKDEGGGWLGGALDASQIDPKDEDTWALVLDFLPPGASQGGGPLAVPFAVQNGVNWCTPTALSMIFNHHRHTAIVSNWELAALGDLDRGITGIPNLTLIDDLGLEPAQFQGALWRGADAAAYISRLNNGESLRDYFGASVTYSWGGATRTIAIPEAPTARRPVQVTLKAANHAVTAVGSSTKQIWLHDSSGAVTGAGDLVASALTWAEFYTAAGGDDVRTVVLWDEPRAEKYRRGSLVFADGAVAAASFIHRAPGVRAALLWDGDQNDTTAWEDRGYRWTATAGSLDNGVYGVKLDPDGELDLQMGVTNITHLSRSYEITVTLYTSESGGSFWDPIDERSHRVSGLSAYQYDPSAAVDGFDLSTLDPDAHYLLRFTLTDIGGVFQDAREILFELDK